MSRTDEPGIATSAAPALSRNPGLAVFGEIEEGLARFLIHHNRSNRNLHRHAHAIVTLTITALAMPAALGDIFRIKPEMQQRIAMYGRNHLDVSTATAVAAAGPAMRNILLPPKRKASIAAIARFDCDSYFINKHKKRPPIA
jgi:hypothetical protein